MNENNKIVIVNAVIGGDAPDETGVATMYAEISVAFAPGVTEIALSEIFAQLVSQLEHGELVHTSAAEDGDGKSWVH